jgi:hypothetical protein
MRIEQLILDVTAMGGDDLTGFIEGHIGKEEDVQVHRAVGIDCPRAYLPLPQARR